MNRSPISILAKNYLREWVDFQPLLGLTLGLPGGEGRYADYSPSGIRKFLNFIRALEKDLRGIQAAGLSSAEWIDYQLLLSEVQLKKKEWGQWREYERDPTRYIGELVYGLWYLFLRVESKTLRVTAALQRLKDSGEILSAARACLTRPPKIWTEIAIQQAKGYVVFLKEVRAELLRLQPKRRSEIQQAVRGAEKIACEFLAFLTGPLKKRSTGEFASGRRAFEFRLRHYHHYSLTASQLHKIGEVSFIQVKEELREQAARIDPKTPWHPLVERLKKVHPSRARLLPVYRKETARLRRFIQHRDLVTLPRDESLKIIPTPVFSRHTVPYAAYVDPPMFGGKNHGTFFVTPVTTRDSKAAEELLGEHNLPSVRVTALHEGYPGHHLQFAKQKTAPGIMMKLFNCSSFYEGWALYCEELMAEVGYYDAETRLMQLKDKLWRACRILVDVGLHTGELSPADAVRLMARELEMSPASARADVNWYTLSPTVPQSYFTGMLRIRELREKCRRAWGSRFTLKRFHNEFLKFGAIPIPLVEKVIL